MTVDDDLVAWQMAQEPTPAELEQRGLYHRCPPDMPPCPVCQERDDDEDWQMQIIEYL